MRKHHSLADNETKNFALTVEDAVDQLVKTIVRITKVRFKLAMLLVFTRYLYTEKFSCNERCTVKVC